MTYTVKNLPPSVKVGTQTYTLEVVDNSVMNDIGIYGDCNCDMRRIRIADTMPEANHAVEVVLHEITHACYRSYHIEAERGEEYTVTNIAAALAGVLVDNPDLRKWIDKASK